MRAIGFTGHARAGKDTAADLLADYIENELGQRVERRSWARKLKVSAARALGIEGTDDELVAWCDRHKDEGILSFQPNRVRLKYHEFTIRNYLEWYGTEAHRGVFGDDFWVDAELPPTVIAPLNAPDWVIFSDTRFDNEARRILQYDGGVFRIQRPGHDALPADGHASRQGVDDAFITAGIRNAATLDHLAADVIDAFQLLLEARQ